MFPKLFVVLVMCFTLNKIKILAKPIEISKPNLNVLPYQLVNNTNLFAYQGFDLKEERKKRFLEDLFYLFNLLENAYDDDDEDQDDSSSEEDISEEDIPKKEFDLCRNCSVTLNKIKQIQQIHHSLSPLDKETSITMPSNQTPSRNTINNMSSTKSTIITTEQNFQASIKNQLLSQTTAKTEVSNVQTVAEKSIEPITEKSAETSIATATINMYSAVTEASAVIESSAATEAPAVIESSSATIASAAIEDSSVTEAPAVIESSAATQAPAVVESSAATEAAAAIENSATSEATAADAKK